jgi:hypothetical protein
MLFKNPVRTSKRTPHLTITKINWLTLFKFKGLISYTVSHLNAAVVVQFLSNRYFLCVSCPSCSCLRFGTHSVSVCLCNKGTRSCNCNCASIKKQRRKCSFGPRDSSNDRTVLIKSTCGERT